MGKIIIKDIQNYAYHGCLPSEKKIGGIYKTTLWIEGDFSESEIDDDLTKTVDYESVILLVKEEMKHSSDLIEHVARRILDKMMGRFSNIKKLKVRVVKIKPPVNADVPQVEYILKKKR
tara:strand:+ start:471 stop:827 length:357 start_codon:yes stop_codon:yes gene_type:complete